MKSDDEILRQTKTFIRLLNQIPPPPKEIPMNSAEYRRSQASVACGAVAKYLQETFSDETDAWLIYVDLMRALQGLETNAPDPMLEKTAFKGRPIDPSALWHTRALVVRLIAARRLIHDEKESPAAEAVFTSLKRPEVLVSANAGLASKSRIISNFVKWGQQLRHRDFKTQDPVIKAEFESWIAGDRQELPTMSPAEQKVWLRGLTAIVQQKIDIWGLTA